MNPLFFITGMLFFSSSWLDAAIHSDSFTSTPEFWSWALLFFISIGALVLLYVTIRHIRLLKQEHLKMQQKQSEIIELQNKILTTMSQDIRSIAEKAMHETKELVLDAQDTKLKSALKHVAKTENRLLDITTDLLEFLRIKSDKVEIVEEPFSLKNLLSDITGQIGASDPHIDFDLLYDVEKGVPQTLVGDMLHVSKVAFNVIDYLKQNGAKSVVVTFSKEGGFASSSLEVRFCSDLLFDIENDAALFLTRFDEKNGQYEGLNLYVAKELTLKMGGELSAYNDQRKQVEFLLKLPLKKAPLGELIPKVESSPKLFSGKKILLIDKNSECLAIDQKIFSNLGLETEGMIRREFNHNVVDFSRYDVVVIEEGLLTSEMLKKLDSYPKLQVVALGSIFSTSHFGEMLQGDLKRPLSESQLLQTFDRLSEKPQQKRSDSVSKIPVHKETFAKTPGVTLQSFADFKGASLLIVEDNFINQKVLLSVLKYSGMDIDIANNGVEALDLILEKKKRYDLVLMDINMPVMDGYTATKKLRQAKLDTLPIVALSALTSPDEIEKMFEVGMNGYLAKPFYKERLYTVFAIFIEKKENSLGATSQTKASFDDAEMLHLEGLNIEEGIQNSKNCEPFYKEVLVEFKEAFGESDRLLHKLVEEQRYEQMRMLCVDLRGLSGAIGARRVYERSVEILHLLIFKKYDLLKESVDAFAVEMQRLNRDIDVYLKLKGENNA